MDNITKRRVIATVRAGKLTMSVSEPENSVARINIDGEIGGWDWDTWEPVNTGKQIREALNAIGDATEVEVLISSLGGDVDAALQIYDALAEKAAKCRVTTIVTGLCASAATVIACAGSVRKISPTSLYLIHKCWGYYVGNENELEEQLDFQRKVNEQMMKIYRRVFKGKNSELDDLMEAANGNGKWITAEEAVNYGFATEMSDVPEPEEAKGKVRSLMASVLNHARSMYPAHETKENHDNNGSENNPPITNQTQTEMKNFLKTFALLAAALAYGAEKEFDEAKGHTLTADELAKLEDALKAGKQASEELESVKAQLQAKTDELTAAQAKAEQDKTAIETLTAERDDFKAKYEAQPAATPKTDGKDTVEGETFADYVDNDPYYQQIQESYAI
ncbi:MAG: ATP-dependent Clp protease proteolytic subunit [Bacteroidales bacterium]|nr:ATP-dependent Clp protease proteolytic subunit [Bacteroidales bacterium]